MQNSPFLTNLTACCAKKMNLSHSAFVFPKQDVDINPFILSMKLEVFNKTEFQQTRQKMETVQLLKHSCVASPKKRIVL